MTLPVQTDPLDFYARHSCALFPLPAGSKTPGPVAFWPSPADPARAGSFKTDCSTDPSQWQAWRVEHPDCNFGVVAFASRLIIVDIDTKIGRDEAWALWCELCTTWGLQNVAMPHVASPSGGWHVMFALPVDVDPSQLRQPDAIKKHINVRCIGYTVAAGSHFNNVPYTLLSDAAPYPAPAALIEHCTRRPTPIARSTNSPGSRDKNDVAALITWLAERGAFGDYESWFQVGMALALEYGDDGFDIWELTFDETVTPDTAASKWASFSQEPDAHSVTLNTFLQRAHALGWRGQVRKSTAAMFDSVAQIAAAAGATLASSLPVPMLAGQEELSRLAAPILQDFLDATADAPSSPASLDLPTLPDTMSGHGLFSLAQSCLRRIFALAESKPNKPARLTDPLAVLSILHADVFESTCRRLRAMGMPLQDRKIKWAAANLSEKVERVTVTLEKWEYDSKGEVQSDNSDNVQVLLGMLGLEIRWNAWLERMEIRGGIDVDLRWPEWSYVDDSIVAKLRTRANRTKTRFRPGKDFFWESLTSLAHANSVDPVLDTLDALAVAWDRSPRLITWLARYCGTPCDIYHQAVGKMIIGGMVKRARHPGCKFDFMPIFYGPQGTGKSSLIAALAIRPEWFTDNVLLGDAAKELILALAGKLVVEISEMGMRGNTNASHIKAMISRQVDAGRTAYARSVTERPRRNVFCGSTNDNSPLEDPTGNRRFLPVQILQEIDLAALRCDIPQLVGEAAALEATGVSFDLPREVWAVAAQYQESARQASDIEVLFSDWFAPTEFSQEAFITVPDIVRLYGALGRKNSGALVHSIMERLGFYQAFPYIEGKRTHVWVRSALPLKPKSIPTLPRYTPDLSQNSPRVVLRSVAVASSIIPPSPSR